MDRLLLMPSGVGFWRRLFYSLVLTSVEAFLALLCLVSGVPILLDPSQLAPGSVSALLPQWLLYMWAAGLVSGGGFSLLGIATNEHRIERIGSLILASVTFVYAFALMWYLPVALFSMIINIGFMLAMLARYWVLGRIIEVIKRIRSEVHNGD